MSKKNAIVLAAHGSSKDPRINRPMFALAERIQNALPTFHVTPAFLDGQPDIRNVIHDIIQNQIVVIPFMASNGYYTDVVFPKALQKPNKSCCFTDAIGAHPAIASMVDQRLKVLLGNSRNAADVEVIVVGHGTKKNRNSCRTTINLVKNLRELNSGVEIKFAFIDQNPSLEHIVDNISSSRVIVIPFLMGLGPHMTDDVPEAFGIGRIADHLFKPAFQFPFSRRSISHSFEVAIDVPVGIYEDIADLCVSIATDKCHGFDKPVEVPA